jgi:hypothetical protein
MVIMARTKKKDEIASYQYRYLKSRGGRSEAVMEDQMVADGEGRKIE